MDESRADQQIGYILRSYPRLSQTFILNEILALEKLGIHLRVFALVDSGEKKFQPQAGRLQARVDCLEEGPRQGWLKKLASLRNTFRSHPVRVLHTLLYLLAHGGNLMQGYTQTTPIQAFWRALYLIDLITQESYSSGKQTSHLHAHFAHDPTLVANLVHRLTGMTYSFTAHARDLFQLPVGLLVERIQAAQAVFTCCQANLDYLRQVTPSQFHTKLHLVHHGVDLSSFQPPKKPSRGKGVPLVVSAGRLIEKKGFADLVAALSQVDRNGINFRGLIYGDGPLREELTNCIQNLGLQEKVCLVGEYTQDQLAASLQQADVFALTPIVTQDGDRDGLPNVLVEAMASGVPVVSTKISGVPDLVVHGKNGYLFSPHDLNGITSGLTSLLTDPFTQEEMGIAARQATLSGFDLRQSAARLAGFFIGRSGIQP